MREELAQKKEVIENMLNTNTETEENFLNLNDIEEDENINHEYDNMEMMTEDEINIEEK